MIYNFNNLSSDNTDVGGKAYMLAMMSQKGIRVPKGLILDAPSSKQELEEIYKFFDNLRTKVAVRSSSRAEDSKENSFAGQNATFLFVDNIKSLETSILNCFKSVDNGASTAYRKHFLGRNETVPMNVVIQEMIDPKFSGVYFSKDPRGVRKGWMFEYIDGVGEDLVSGKRTPKVMSENDLDFSDISNVQIEELVSFTKEIEATFSDSFDIEWAIGQDDRVYILQARPITAQYSHTNIKSLFDKELERIKIEYDRDTMWDGQTFSELTVAPSTFSSDLWAKSFEPDMAFDTALKKIGYLGFKDKDSKSVLNTIFGKNYINLKELGKLYFGEIPYKMNPKPRPHLEFKFSLISPKIILDTPFTLWKMLSVGLSVNTNRRAIIKEATEDLVKLSNRIDRPSRVDFYHDWSSEDIDNRITKEWETFSKKTLVWPYVLISLTETTIQTMHSLLASIFSQEETTTFIKRWSGEGLNTKTYEMNMYFKKACARPELRKLFIDTYGHRGPGELDLSTKRWAEIADKCFYDIDYKEYEQSKQKHKILDVEAEINAMKTFKKTILLEEWRILKNLLELREEWKMNILKPFSHIRFLLLEKAKRLNLSDSNDIFWLHYSEIMNFKDEYQDLIIQRKTNSKNFKNINLSSVTSLTEMEDILSGKQTGSDNLQGEGLSTGLVKGTVVVIDDPSEFTDFNWPENPVIVAQSTDPGWTSIFIKASGIIVEKGGVLSHCAIVAREMGIPAVSGIRNCHLRFKGGENVWVNGSTGSIVLN